MRCAALVIVAACSAPPSPAPVAVQPAAPRVEIVAEIGASLRWFTVGDGVRETRTVALPKPIRELAWLGHEPVVLLEDDRVAIVTARGLEYVVLPPVSTWSAAPAPGQAGEPRETPDTRLFVKADEIWVGRCDAAPHMYTLGCGNWVDVRVRPQPLVVETGASTESLNVEVEIPRPVPPVPPAPTIQAQLVPDPERHEGTREKLRCTANGKTIEQPAVGEEVLAENHIVTLGGRSDLVWLSTEPPIFELTDWDNCAPCPTRVVYEGCTRSRKYGSVQVGPDEVMAFWVNKPGDAWNISSRTLVRRGRTLGTIDGVRHFAFVPR